ncbi:MAG TPA: ester cyclase [Gaiellaceae bacterium]
MSAAETMGTASTARRFIEEVLDTGDWSRADELLTDDVVMHHPSAPEPIRGREAVQGFLSQFRAGMPDLHLAVDDVAGSDDRVAVRWHAQGTHRNEMFGIPPTNNEISIRGISFFRFEDGRIAEDWIEENTLAVLQQLGVVPQLG